jgi:hypothetical protein
VHATQIRPPAISNQATNEKPRPQGSTDEALNLEVSQHPEKLGRSREHLGRKSIKAMAGGKLEPSQSCDGTVDGSGGLTPRREAPRHSHQEDGLSLPPAGAVFGLVSEIASSRHILVVQWSIRRSYSTERSISN